MINQEFGIRDKSFYDSPLINTGMEPARERRNGQTVEI
jgi:hypothetical protein